MKKQCTRCGTSKKIEEFNFDKQNADGHCAQCKTCKQTSRRLRKNHKLDCIERAIPAEESHPYRKDWKKTGGIFKNASPEMKAVLDDIAKRPRNEHPIMKVLRDPKVMKKVVEDSNKMQRDLVEKAEKIKVPIKDTRWSDAFEPNIEGSHDLNFICDCILERHNAHFNISVWKDHCTCTIHGSPQKVFKAKTPDELMTKVLQ